HVNIVREQVADIRKHPIVDDEEEVDLEVIDSNVNKQRGVGNKAFEKAIYGTDFDDIKEALEILTAQHRSIMEHIEAQDEKVIKLYKTLITMASNSVEIGAQVPMAVPSKRRFSYRERV
ncbi:hypothetical protein HAX54_012039, partial [Datura stramonium]|nr:hypothetical protein [Datura stramonium]